MKFQHSVKFQLNRQYEMHEFSVELDDAEFPELQGLPALKRARFMQGMLLQMGLVFQAASGYIKPDSLEFQESWRLAAELKGVSEDTPKLKSV